jgi:hypothetical protein
MTPLGMKVVSCDNNTTCIGLERNWVETMSDRWFVLTAAFAAGAAATLVVQGLIRSQSQDRRYGKQQWWLRGGAN